MGKNRWYINEMDTPRDAFFEEGYYPSKYGHLHGVGLFEGPSMSHFGHYVEGKIHGAALEHFGGGWALGTYFEDELVLGLDAPEDGVRNCLGLVGVGAIKSTHVLEDNRAGIVGLVEGEAVVKTGDTCVVQQLFDKLVAVGFGKEEVHQMMAVLAPISLNRWQYRSAHWTQDAPLIFGGVLCHYLTEPAAEKLLHRLQRVNSEVDELHEDVISSAGVTLLAEHAACRPKLAWRSESHLLNEVLTAVCSVAFYFDKGGEFESDVSSNLPGNLPPDLQGAVGVNVSLMMSSVLSIHRSWSSELGAEGEVPMSETAVAKLWACESAAGDVRNALHEVLFSPWSEFEGVDLEPGELYALALNAEEALSNSVGPKAAKKIMNAYAEAVFHKSTWIRGLVSTISETPMAEISGVDKARSIEEHGFFAQYMMRRYAEMVLMQNEGVTPAFDIQELLLRLTEPGLLVRLASYSDGWISGPESMENSMKSMFGVTEAKLDAVSFDVRSCPTDVALMRLVAARELDIVFSAVLLAKYESLLAKKAMIELSQRAEIRNHVLPSTDRLFEKAFVRCDALLQFLESQAERVDGWNKVHALSLLLEEVFLFAQDVWSIEAEGE